MKEKLKQIHERNKAKKEERRRKKEEASKCGTSFAERFVFAVQQEFMRRQKVNSDWLNHRADRGERFVPIPKD